MVSTISTSKAASVSLSVSTAPPANANCGCDCKDDQKSASPTTTQDQANLTGSGAPATATLPASNAAQSVQGEKASSVGDPHETTGDGTKFDNERTGEFIKAQSQSGDFVLQTRQDHPIQNSNVTINTAAAAKLGPDVVNYDAKTRTLTVNGQATTLSDGQTTQLPGGGSVALNKDTYTLTSPKGDQVTLQDVGGGLNVGLTLGNRTAGEVKGELGNFDGAGQGGQELVGRDGTTYDAKDSTQLGKYLDDWSVKSGESLFDGERAANQTAGSGTAANPTADTTTPNAGSGSAPTAGATAPTAGATAPNGGTGPADAANTANNPAQPQDPQQLIGQLEQLMQNFIQEFSSLLGQQAPTAPAPTGGAADTTAPATTPTPIAQTAPDTAPTAPAPAAPAAQSSDNGGFDLSALTGLFSSFTKLFGGLL